MVYEINKNCTFFMNNIIFCPSVFLTKTCDSSDYTECAGI